MKPVALVIAAQVAFAAAARVVFAAAAVLATVVCADAATAQVPEGFGYAAAAAYPHQVMTAATIRIPVGSGHDPEGSGGTAWLLGSIRAAQAAQRVDPADATISVVVDRSTTVYTILSAPQAWTAVWGEVEDVIFRAPVPEALFVSHRAALLEDLVFESGSPVVDFAREAATLRAPLGSPWARPVQGVPTTVRGLTLAGLDAFRRAHYRPIDAAVAVVGPLADGRAISLADPPARPDVAWLVGDRVDLTQEVTSAWVSVAFPAPSTVSRTDLEFVSYLVKEELDPTPPRPDRFGVTVDLEETPGGTVLLIEASVLPEAVAAWEARIRDAVSSLTREAMAPDFFQWSRRRFRSWRIVDQAAPEREAARMSADLLRSGRARDLVEEMWGLTPASLLDAARALGEPRIFVLGAALGS